MVPPEKYTTVSPTSLSDILIPSAASNLVSSSSALRISFILPFLSVDGIISKDLGPTWEIRASSCRKRMVTGSGDIARDSLSVGKVRMLAGNRCPISRPNAGKISDEWVWSFWMYFSGVFCRPEEGNLFLLSVGRKSLWTGSMSISASILSSSSKTSEPCDEMSGVSPEIREIFYLGRIRIVNCKWLAK